eukprot:COSAG04_NODE_1066_length_8488_cov_2.933246_2_plen_261_part_00
MCPQVSPSLSYLSHKCAKFEQDQSGIVGMFVEKTKAQNDAAGVAAVIAEAVGHEKLFVFGELLELEPVRALEGDAAHGAAFSLLKLFAYGTFADGAGAGLSPEQQAKLRLLTIVSLAQDAKAISYESLLAALQISEIRELEDVVIEAIYSGLVNAKLDQKGKAVEVLSAVGRDVDPADIVKMQQKLAEWAGASDAVVTAIEEKTKFANDMSQAEAAHQKQLKEEIANVKAILKAQGPDDEGGGGAPAKHRSARNRPSRPA